MNDIVWNEDAFANLMLPLNRKQLLRSVIEAHDSETGSGDFVKGKGDGLVINLSGPPGVGTYCADDPIHILKSSLRIPGKTFAAEAMSEQVKRPLYIVGDVDIGTKAVEVDATLERILKVASAWKAIVLIDEVSLLCLVNPLISLMQILGRRIP